MQFSGLSFVLSITLLITGCTMVRPGLVSKSIDHENAKKCNTSNVTVAKKPTDPCIKTATSTSMGELYYELGCKDINYVQAAEWFLRAAQEGDPHAQYRLAELYYQGAGVNRDLVKSSEWLRMAAANGVIPAQVRLAEFYREGKGVEKSNLSAILWYERAAKAGDMTAILSLGEMYKGWPGMQPDLDKAMYWYQQGAALGSEQAGYQIAWLLARGVNVDPKKNKTHHTVDYKRAELLFKQAGDKGQVDAYAQLGDLYSEGKINNHRDLKLARLYYLKAANAGSAEGAFRLGMLALVGKLNVEPCPDDYLQALRWFEQAAEAGMPMAQYQLAELYMHGYGTPRNCERAVYWYRQAACHALPMAQVKIADLYHGGRANLPRDLKQAAHWYTLAADNGDTYALYMLSVMYRQGRGVKANFAKSVELAERAASHSNALLAQYQIGNRFLLGQGLEKNNKMAEKWYLQAANGGLSSAQNALGDLYMHQLSYHHDYALAYRWYRQAAMQGSSYGEYNAALLLARNKGVEYSEENPRIAVQLLKNSARKGFRPAQVELAWHYFEGAGVRQDYARAYAWWTIALEDKYEANPEFIEYIIDEMKPNMQSLAVRYAARFRERYSPTLNNHQLLAQAGEH